MKAKKVVLKGCGKIKNLIIISNQRECNAIADILFHGEKVSVGEFESKYIEKGYLKFEQLMEILNR